MGDETREKLREIAMATDDFFRARLDQIDNSDNRGLTPF